MEELYLKNRCSSCHGLYAEGIGATPRLQGKSEGLLKERLKNLKEGKTRSAFGTIMISFAQALNDEQIDKMTHWLANLKKWNPKSDMNWSIMTTPETVRRSLKRLPLQHKGSDDQCVATSGCS